MKKQYGQVNCPFGRGVVRLERRALVEARHLASCTEPQGGFVDLSPALTARYRKSLVDRGFCDNMVYETTTDAHGGSQNHMSERIVIDPKICHGKPVIRGTRMSVALVVGSLAGGMSFEEVQREYDLTIDDVRAALKFAGELVEQEQHHPLPG